MPACPACGAPLYPGEIAEGQCTSCMKRLPAGFTGQEPSARRPSAARSSSGSLARRWMWVRWGLSLFWWGVLLNLLCSLLTIAAFVVIAGLEGLPPEVREGLPWALLGAYGGSVLGGLLTLLGIGLSLLVPAEARAGGWVRGFLICLVLMLLLGLTAGGAMVGERYMLEPAPLRLLAVVALWTIVPVLPVASFCLVMTYRAVARFLGDPGLGGSFIAYFVTSLLSPLILLALAGVLALTVERGVAGIGFLLLDAVLVVVMLVWFLTLLSRLSELIPTRLGAGG